MGLSLSTLRRLAPAPTLSAAAFLARLSLSAGYRKAQFDALQQAGAALAAKHESTASSYRSLRTVSALRAAHAWPRRPAPKEPTLDEYMAHFDVFARLEQADREHATIQRARARRGGIPPSLSGGGEVERIVRIVYGVGGDIVAPHLSPADVWAQLEARVDAAPQRARSPAARVALHAPVAGVRALVVSVARVAARASTQGLLLLPQGEHLASTLAFLDVYEALWAAALDAAPVHKRQAALCALSREAVLTVLEADLPAWRGVARMHDTSSI
ncbi:hypothetical protein Q8F55_006023 [Vanrija albida]|uniref:Ubiquinone biosynthesis protein n=1 Tax=Vanrija albida TaxID=181172 RepID=A0ABR3Q368_9TREE